MKDLIDLHTHTIASGHAYSTLDEMVRAAADAKLAVLGSSDHTSGMPGACHDFYFINFKVIPRTMHGVKLLMGCELNIIDYCGNVDLPAETLAGLDYSIASIHPPCYSNGTTAQNTAAYVGAVENPLIHIIGHPDDSRFPCDYDTLAAAAKANHTLLEINNSSLKPNGFRKNTAENYKYMLEKCRYYETSVIINSDAHISGDVGSHQYALALLAEVGFPDHLVVNYSLAQLSSFLPHLNDLIK